MTTHSLREALRQHRLLDLKQLGELDTLHFAEPKSLAKELIERAWLTPYQANQLLKGKGQELVLGQYLLLEKLGEGGMGQVFKARHLYMNRIVALKLIRKERLGSPDAVRRFQREVRAVAALAHPNIVLAHDADEIGGTHLLVMEYIEGAIDLAKLVKKNGPLAVPQACEFIRQAALGLQHASERGLVHRDIKPANLLLTGNGKVVKILDMGLARLDHPGADDDQPSTMTQEGAVMGTPDYIAPEQALDTHTADIRADLYSLGCAFYYLLIGRAPFVGGTMMEKLMKHRLEDPTPVEQLRPEVPPPVARVVGKLMAKKPADRYQTPAEVATALAAVSSPCGFATAAIANDLTRVQGGPAQAVKEVRTVTFAPVNASLEKRDDTIAFEPPQPLPEKPKHRFWWMVGAVGSFGLVGLLVVYLVLQGSTKNKQPEKENGDAQVQKKDPPKKEEGGVPPKNFINSIGMKFVWIPPGSFIMGSPKEEDGRGTNETQHKVTLTKGFYMGVHATTQEQWQEFMGKNPSHFKGEKNLPVDNVSWLDCQEFIRKMREQEGKPYRLPTEAEREYACRAGTTTRFHSGDTLSAEQANYDTDRTGGTGKKGASREKTTPVGRFPANAWGLHDMHGNLYEWCQDWYGDYPEKDVVDPQGPEAGKERVLRGGAWNLRPSYCRSAARSSCAPGTFRYNLMSFRLCFCPN